MMSRRIETRIAALMLVLGVLMLFAPVRARAGNGPCALISIGETEALTGEKVVRSLERGSVCQRWTAGGRTLILTLGASETQEPVAASREMGGAWVSKQFGDLTCTSVIVPSHPRANSTACAARAEPLFFGDGFDNATGVTKGPVYFTLQVTGGSTGIVSVERVRALAEKVLARLR